MRRIKSLVTDRYSKALYCRISDGIEYSANQLHLGIFGGQPPAELHKRAAGQGVFVIIDVQGVAPPDVEAEGIQRLLIAQVVPLLQEAQAEQAGNAEIGPARGAIEHRVVIFLPEQDGKHFAPEQVSP